MEMRIEGELDESAESLFLRVSGDDRPNVIADVTGRLEETGLYVAAVHFGLALPKQDQFAMEVLAKGRVAELREAHQRMVIEPQTGYSHDIASNPARRINWTTANLFHLALYTPDQEGLTAQLARIVGARRDDKESGGCPHGSFVHLIGNTHNAGGPQGATPYYSLRADVATESMGVQEQIVEALHEFANAEGFGGDLWTRDLNRA